MNIVLQIAVGLLGLGFLITIHELGHFAVAKWTGVRVNTFSIGFGPKLLKFQYGETSYCISAIPFGGYVAMSGESPKEGGGQGYTEGDFQSKPIWVRAAIALAGPAVNILFCILILWVVYLVGYPKQGGGVPVVGMVSAASAGEKAGFKAGDTLVSIGGQPLKNWQSFQEEFSMSLGKSLTVEVKRDSGTRLLSLVPTEMSFKGKDLGVGDAGLIPALTLVARQIPDNSPARRGGVQEGDTMISFAGQKIYGNLFEMVQANGAKPALLGVKRADGYHDLQVTPEARAISDCPNGKPCVMLNLPLGLPERFEKYGPIDALKGSLVDSYNYALMPFKFIEKILSGGIKLKAMSGPVGIVQVMGKSFTFGVVEFVLLIALISMNLGIMNLLPLAITDGGILLFLLLEWIRGRPIRAEIQQRIQQIAVFFFISLFLYVLVQDLLRVSLFY